MDIKKELPHFYIGSSLGGQQKWYSRITNFGMNVGGCAAITACDCAIYFEKYFGLHGLYPFDLQNISRENYLRFGKIMEPYFYPRWSGVDKLEIYLDGFGRFVNYTRLRLKAKRRELPESLRLRRRLRLISSHTGFTSRSPCGR